MLSFDCSHKLFVHSRSSTHHVTGNHHVGAFAALLVPVVKGDSTLPRPGTQAPIPLRAIGLLTSSGQAEVTRSLGQSTSF